MNQIYCSAVQLLGPKPSSGLSVALVSHRPTHMLFGHVVCPSLSEAKLFCLAPSDSSKAKPHWHMDLPTPDAELAVTSSIKHSMHKETKE